MDIKDEINSEVTTNEVITTESILTNNSIYNITFQKTYKFEGQNYDGIDLSGIENISTKQLVEVDKLFYATGNMAPTSEMSLAYACIVASKVSNKPLEFFTGLSGKEGIKVKTAVVNFLYN